MAIYKIKWLPLTMAVDIRMMCDEACAYLLSFTVLPVVRSACLRFHKEDRAEMISKVMKTQ